ncbi:MAG: hypothetical protein ACFFAE_16215 [Candidatus Hodarchaeota archaeon]
MEPKLVKSFQERLITKNIEFKGIYILFIMIIVIRIVFIFLNPLLTSDLSRNIFFGKHFWEYGLGIYDHTPLDIDPSYEVVDPISGLLSWPNNKYDYPIFHLLFFGIVVLLPSSILISKTIFTLFDLVNFFLIRSNERFEKIAWLYFIISSPFTSLEGQVTSITIFLFFASFHLYRSNHQRLGYFFIAIGFQWKIIELILFPYYILKDLLEFRKETRIISGQELLIRIICFSIPLGILTIIPFLFSGYLLNSMFFSGSYISHEQQSPLYLLRPSFSSLFLVITLSFILITWIKLGAQWEKGIDFIPLLELGFFYLLYPLSTPWTWFYLFPCYFIIPKNEPLKVKYILLLLLCTFLIASLEFLVFTGGFERLITALNPGWF